MIDSLTNTNVYFEKKFVIEIKGNSTTNSNGVLEVDEKANPLISLIDCGDTYLYRLASYTGGDGFMLYNETTKNIQICRVGDPLNVTIDFARGTKYFLGAKKLKSTAKTNSVFSVDLGESRVFKVFVEGVEVKDYAFNSTSVTITGSSRYLIDEFSVLTVYAYKSNTITTESFTLEYYGFDTIWEKDSFMDGSYFEAFRGEEITLFESLNVNQTTQKTTYKTSFANSQQNRLSSVENVVDINLFDARGNIDLVQAVGKDEFRLVLNNPMFGRIVLINNCRIDNGVSLSFEKEKNTKRINIPCGNYIDIRLGENTLYGARAYGKGQYGGGDYVYNSARAGDSL